MSEDMRAGAGEAPSIRHQLWLEHRRRLLSRSIAYVEDQREDLSRETLDFLEWAAGELLLVETLLADHVAQTRSGPRLIQTCQAA